MKPAPGPAEQRYRMIAEAAYYLAEKDGFTGDSFNYWIAAERQIDMQLEQGR